jgi:hypothetical protein
MTFRASFRRCQQVQTDFLLDSGIAAADLEILRKPPPEASLAGFPLIS